MAIIDSMLEFDDLVMDGVASGAIKESGELDLSGLMANGEPLYLNAAIKVALNGAADTNNPLVLQLKGSATTGGALTVLATWYMGSIAEVNGRLGAKVRALLPTSIVDYPFTKISILNDDGADAMHATGGTVALWLGAHPDAGHPRQ